MESEKEGYYKIVVLFSFLFILATAVFAVEVKILLKEGESTVVNGKTVLLTNVGEERITVDVDGIIKNVEKVYNSTGGAVASLVNGAWIAIEATSPDNKNAVLSIEVNYTCGDDICEGETTRSCCEDCGCTRSYDICEKNQCIQNVSQTASQCNTDVDCMGSVGCTIGRCDTTVFPTRCLYIQQEACIADDACCPRTCNKETDPDCLVVNQCSSNAECDDKNACTIDLCAGSPRQCTMQAQAGCPLGNICRPVGSQLDSKYCAQSGTWVLQRSYFVSCTQNHECFSNVCDDNMCVDKIEKVRNYFKTVLYVVFGLLVFILLFYTILAIVKRH